MLGFTWVPANEKFLVIVGNFFDATLRYCKVWRFIEMGVVFSYNMNH